jgi:hypothetical protein
MPKIQNTDPMRQARELGFGLTAGVDAQRVDRFLTPADRRVLSEWVAEGKEVPEIRWLFNMRGALWNNCGQAVTGHWDDAAVAALIADL